MSDLAEGWDASPFTKFCTTDFHRMPRPMDIPRSESNPEKMDHEKQVPVASAPPPEHMGKGGKLNKCIIYFH